MSGSITLTHETRDRLRASYNIAVRDGKEQFRFDGNDILTAYAKYLLQHLDNTLGEETPA